MLIHKLIITISVFLYQWIFFCWWYETMLSLWPATLCAVLILLFVLRNFLEWAWHEIGWFDNGVVGEVVCVGVVVNIIARTINLLIKLFLATTIITTIIPPTMPKTWRRSSQDTFKIRIFLNQHNIRLCQLLPLTFQLLQTSTNPLNRQSELL